MTVTQGRVFFSSRSSMLSTVKSNIKGDPEFRTYGYLCQCKEHLDTQNDLLKCKLYENLKNGLDPYNSDIDLVKFFMLVIKQRRKEEEN